MKKKISLILFLFGLIGIVFFFTWSNLYWITIVLLLVLDSLCLKVIPTFLKKKLGNTIYQFLSYFYILILPVVFTIFFRTFFYDFYYVPSSSMEKTLLPGDYVFVNKISYGVKVPKYLSDVPVIGQLFEAPKNESDLYSSLHAFSELKTEDIIVLKAVNKADQFLVKRIIGMPGDTLKIHQSKTFVNSQELKEKEDYSHVYVDIENNSRETFSNKEFSEKSAIEKDQYVRQIQQNYNFEPYLFPRIKHGVWTKDNYGTLVIPKKGMTIQLTQENIDLYYSTVVRFENSNLRLKKMSSILFNVIITL